MKFVKRSTLAMLSVGLMVTVAGYINYKYNPEREKNLGQTVYVNGKDGYTYDNVSIYGNDKDISSTNANASNESNAKQDDSIAVFKYDRDNMFSELGENYAKIINNSSTSAEQVNEYQKKLDELISKKNLINMVENVIKSKGIEDIVIIPTNNDNINVVVKSSTELKKEQIAQIQQILVDQLGADASKLSITEKKV
ncbi:MAG: SpoIIIAH-like family protein [Clostridia bacterium]|nr:SpoIIIAH-like family protein [Clostridia bacterium]